MHAQIQFNLFCVFRKRLQVVLILQKSIISSSAYSIPVYFMLRHYRCQNALMLLHIWPGEEVRCGC